MSDSDLDDRVLRLKTAKECVAFAANVSRTRPDLAAAARRRAVQLRAAGHGAISKAEREALEAVYAFEDVRSQEAGRRVRASRTWQSFERKGILRTVEDIVSRGRATIAYEALVAAGLERFTFEAVVLRYPECFSDECIAQAKVRLPKENWPR